MSIQFFPFNIPSSMSMAKNATLAITTSLAGFPTTASLADFVVNYTGPTGPSGSTVSGSNVEVIG